MNKLNQTPLHIAALNSNEEITLPKKWVYWIYWSKIYFFHSGNEKFADLLIKSGANVNALDKNEREALQHTVYNGNLWK